MSRSGYSDDYEYIGLYRHAVDRSFNGARGQAFLRKLAAALDALPVKALITDAVRDDAGNVCALGAVDPSAEGYDAEELARHFGIARAMAAEIVYKNDEYHTQYYSFRTPETPEQRWTRMCEWVRSKLLPEFD